MSDESLYFAVKSIGLSKVQGRKPCTLLQAARHNLRELQADAGFGRSINPALSQRNEILAGPASADEIQAQAIGLIPDDVASKLRKDHCQAVEALFSLSVVSQLDATQYFDRCLTWLRGALPLPILSTVIHRDETAEHMHVLLLPVKDGRHVGGSLITRGPLRILRQAFFEKVAGPAGMRREGAKFRGATKQRAVKDVLRFCQDQNLPQHMKELWPLFSATIQRDPTPAALALNLYGVDTNQPQVSTENEGETPIGFPNETTSVSTLSCVGFAPCNRSTDMEVAS